MKRTVIVTLSVSICSLCFSAEYGESALTYLRSVEKAASLREQGSAVLTAFGRGFDAYQIHRICSDGTLAENDRLLQGQETWKVNPSLKSCCNTFGNAYIPGSTASLLKPFIGLSVPVKPRGKMYDLKADAANFVADKLLNYPVEKILEAVETTSSEGVTKTFGICRAALDFETRKESQ